MRKYLLILIGICLFLTVVWFSSGRQLSTGEESFSSFNLIGLHRQVSVWQSSGLGYPMPIYITRLFPIILVKILSALRVPMFMIQAFLYLVLLLTSTWGMFVLTNYLISKKKNAFKISVLASLFYLFNLYTLSQVINRFLYSGLFLWAYLPIFIYLWTRWVLEVKSRWLFWILLTSSFYSVVYLQPAHIITLWAPALIGSLFFSIRNKNNVLKIILASALGMALWLLVNFWWLYPYIKIETSAFSEISTPTANFDSLRGVSQYFPINQIFLLRQSFLFGQGSHWYNFYARPWTYLVSLIVLLVAVVGWIKTRKEKIWLYFSVLAFVGLFVSKGTNPPFGYSFFKLLFSIFPAAGSLRNSYEKFGIVFLLPYSIFFGLGVSWIYQKLKPKIREATVGIVLFLSCGILVWPMWTGKVFSESVRVKIPDYYKQANDYLNQDKSSGRILMLPIIPGDGVRYSWNYQGVEPSEFLFDKPAISKILRTKYADDKYWQLYESFINNKDYKRILSEMNIKYLILHDDLIPEVSGASSSAQVRKTLEKNKNITLVNKYGQLEVYKYNGNERGELFTVESEKPETINYREANNRHYIVSIKNAKKPYSLIFKETFNDLWQARIDGIAVRDHFLVYDYANGWKVNKLGDYNIEIVFKVWPWE